MSRPPPRSESEQKKTRRLSIPAPLDCRLHEPQEIRPMQNILTQLDAPSLSRLRRWGGILLSAAAVLFLAFDAVIKLLEIQPVVEAFAHLGYPDRLARG